MKENVNQRIKAVMDHQSWDDQRLADAVGKHRTTIGRIINGLTVPPKSTVHLIANALGSSYAYLQFGNGPMIVDEIKDKNKVSELSLLQRALNKLEQQLDKKDEIIDKLITQMSGGKPSNSFLQALNATGVRKRTSLRVAA